MTAFYNAGGKIELQTSLNELVKRGLQMPGATCGMWGVCGAVSSLGALYLLSKEPGRYQRMIPGEIICCLLPMH